MHVRWKRIAPIIIIGAVNMSMWTSSWGCFPIQVFFLVITLAMAAGAWGRCQQWFACFVMSLPMFFALLLEPSLFTATGYALALLIHSGFVRIGHGITHPDDLPDHHVAVPAD